jgi:hypothetical protein
MEKLKFIILDYKKKKKEKKEKLKEEEKSCIYL